MATLKGTVSRRCGLRSYFEEEVEKVRAKRVTLVLICCIIAGMAATSVCAQEYQHTFILENTSNLFVDGVCFGMELEPQEPSSDLSMLFGTVEAVVTYDSGNQLSSIRFIDSNINLGNVQVDVLAPGLGGVPGSATANVGLSNAAGTLNLALRDIVLDITSDQTHTLCGAQIVSEDINYSIAQGQLDLRSGILGGSNVFSGSPLVHNGSPSGAILQYNNQLEMALPFNLLLDLEAITGVAGDYLSFNGHLNSSAAVPEPSSLVLLMVGVSVVLLRRRRS